MNISDNRTLNSDLTFSSIFKPSSSPGPLNEEIELRFALSKDPLKIQLIFKFDVVSSKLFCNSHYN